MNSPDARRRPGRRAAADLNPSPKRTEAQNGSAVVDPETCRHRRTLPSPDGDLCPACGALVPRLLPSDCDTARAYIARLRRIVADARARASA